MNIESISPANRGTTGAAGPAPATPRPAPRDRGGPVQESQARAIREANAETRARAMADQKAVLQDTVDAASERLSVLNRSLTFQVHEGTGQLMVQVVDRNTGDVLRETPPKEFLDLAVRLEEMVGFFFDETR